MSNRTITYITDSEGKKHPAEVRGCVPQKDLVVIYRDFATTKLLTESFTWVDGKWHSKSGFSCDYNGGTVNTTPEVTIRLSKK